MHTGRNFSKNKTLPNLNPKFEGINFTNAAKVIKAPTAAKVIKAIRHATRNFYRQPRFLGIGTV